MTPFRLGELSLPYYLQRVAGESAVRTLVSLLLVRLLELWLVIAMAAVSIYLLLESAPQNGGITIAIFVIVLTGVLASFGQLMVLGVLFVRRISEWFGLNQHAKVRGLVHQLETAIGNRSVSAHSNGSACFLLPLLSC